MERHYAIKLIVGLCLLLITARVAFCTNKTDNKGEIKVGKEIIKVKKMMYISEPYAVILNESQRQLDPPKPYEGDEEAEDAVLFIKELDLEINVKIYDAWFAPNDNDKHYKVFLGKIKNCSKSTCDGDGDRHGWVEGIGILDSRSTTSKSQHVTVIEGEAFIHPNQYIDIAPISRLRDSPILKPSNLNNSRALDDASIEEKRVLVNYELTPENFYAETFHHSPFMSAVHVGSPTDYHTDYSIDPSIRLCKVKLDIDQKLGKFLQCDRRKVECGSYLTRVVKIINGIFRQIDIDGIGGSDGIRLEIERFEIHDKSKGAFYEMFKDLDKTKTIVDTLKNYSTYVQSNKKTRGCKKYCLHALMVRVNNWGSTAGLSWVSGLCKRPSMNGKCTNTIVLNANSLVGLASSQYPLTRALGLTASHELIHNFGVQHDDKVEQYYLNCKPKDYRKYGYNLMWNVLKGTENLRNEDKLSECTVKQLRAYQAHYRKYGRKKKCLITFCSEYQKRCPKGLKCFDVFNNSPAAGYKCCPSATTGKCKNVKIVPKKSKIVLQGNIVGVGASGKTPVPFSNLPILLCYVLLLPTISGAITVR